MVLNLMSRSRNQGGIAKAKFCFLLFGHSLLHPYIFKNNYATSFLAPVGGETA